ncbi:MAG: MBL fold metallo-hydrolase [Bacilli bacterium]
MKFCVLASGSKGNCTFIQIGNHKFLIDAGTNFLYISNKLAEINVEPCEIEGIFITHSHIDHISALKRIIKVINPTIYISSKTMNELPFKLEKYYLNENEIIINDFSVSSFILSHDVAECRGYLFKHLDKDLVYITDTGYINQKYNNLLFNRTVYIIEANHDVDLLMSSNRPHFLKMRILGDSGHISNKDCSYYLKSFIGTKTEKIVLAHLSENNNSSELAYSTVSDLIDFDKEIIITTQNERTEVFSI